jgi:hypothetical protein
MLSTRALHSNAISRMSASQIQFGRDAEDKEFEQIQEFMKSKGLAGDKLDRQLTKVQFADDLASSKETLKILNTVSQKSPDDPTPWGATLREFKSPSEAEDSLNQQKILMSWVEDVVKLTAKVAGDNPNSLLNKLKGKLGYKLLCWQPTPNQVLTVVTPKESSDPAVFEYLD